jgi:hypothetical protein
MQTYLNTAFNGLIHGWDVANDKWVGNSAPVECGGHRYCTYDKSKEVYVFHDGNYGRLN